nr:MAG TPA: hypothetical protein [Bacteriophage sp.]
MLSKICTLEAIAPIVINSLSESLVNKVFVRSVSHFCLKIQIKTIFSPKGCISTPLLCVSISFQFP